MHIRKGYEGDICQSFLDHSTVRTHWQKQGGYRMTSNLVALTWIWQGCIHVPTQKISALKANLVMVVKHTSIVFCIGDQEHIV